MKRNNAKIKKSPRIAKICFCHVSILKYGNYYVPMTNHQTRFSVLQDTLLRIPSAITLSIEALESKEHKALQNYTPLVSKLTDSITLNGMLTGNFLIIGKMPSIPALVIPHRQPTSLALLIALLTKSPHFLVIKTQNGSFSPQLLRHLIS